MLKGTTITMTALLAMTAGAYANQDATGLGDSNSSGIQSENDQTDPQSGCAGDVTDDNRADVNDLSKVFASWGLSCAQDCDLEGDANDDNTVDVMDLMLVVLNWGACETDEADDPHTDDFGDGANPNRDHDPADSLDDLNSQPADPDPFADDFGDDANPNRDNDAGDSLGDVNSQPADEPDPFSDNWSDDANPNRPSPDGPIPGGQPDLPDEPNPAATDTSNAAGRR